jgi:hypothetical protein
MMKMRNAGLLLLAVTVLIQLIPRSRSLPEVNPAEDFNPERAVSELALLRSACYDCHSNETRYPWYARVQPVAKWIDHHVEEGRDELNFSIWHTYSDKRRRRKLEECIEVLERGEMPLTSYKLTHPESRLTDAERQLLTDWFRSLLESH